MKNLNFAAFVEACKKGAMSLLWRTGVAAVVGLISIVANSLELLNLSPQVVLFLSFVLGEVSKQINTWSQTKLGVANKQ